MPLRIAILGLLPDVGHLIPLLRVGAALRAFGIEVVAFVNDDHCDFAQQYGIPYRKLGTLKSDELDWAKRRFSYSFWAGADWEVFETYCDGVKIAALQCVPTLERELRDFAPDVLVADQHILRDWYERLAARLDVPLLLHSSSGTAWAWMRPFSYTWINGRGNLPKWIESTLAGAQKTYMMRARPAVRAALDWSADYRHIRDRRSAIREDIDTQLRKVLPHSSKAAEAARVWRFSTGFGVLEGERVRSIVPPDVHFWGPVMPESPPPLPPELGAWIDQQGARPIVYISFGSIIPPTSRLVAQVRSAVEKLDVSALWATSTAARWPKSPRLRFECRVPQPSVLAAPQVKACVTHGGSGTVFETLAFGKPLVCLPVMTDGFYNSSLIEAIGLGKRLSMRTLSTNKLMRALREVLWEPRYARTCRATRTELQAADSTRSILALLHRIVSKSQTTAMESVA